MQSVEKNRKMSVKRTSSAAPAMDAEWIRPIGLRISSWSWLIFIQGLCGFLQITRKIDENRKNRRCGPKGNDNQKLFSFCRETHHWESHYYQKSKETVGSRPFKKSSWSQRLSSCSQSLWWHKCLASIGPWTEPGRWYTSVQSDASNVPKYSKLPSDICLKRRTDIIQDHRSLDHHHMLLSHHVQGHLAKWLKSIAFKHFAAFCGDVLEDWNPPIASWSKSMDANLVTIHFSQL